MLQQRPNTFAQTILSLSFFACDKAADHTFRFADKIGFEGFLAHSEFLARIRNSDSNRKTEAGWDS